MTQYTALVEHQRIQMLKEIWERKVNYLVAENGTIKIVYNNGKIRYQATRDLNGRKEGQVWWEYSNKTNEQLEGEFRHNEADRVSQFKHAPVRDLQREQELKKAESLRIRLGRWLLKDGK
tara:strand:+ start:655 stop:1014 length:360 start_codon:yes stop_codon:yes gene_type:complete